MQISNNFVVGTQQNKPKIDFVQNKFLEYF